MNKKIFLLVLIVVLVAITPTVSAQFSIGGEANQKLIEVNLDETGNVYVKHVVSSTNTPVSVNLFEGTISNLIVTNEEGEEKDTAIVDDGSGRKSIMIFSYKTKFNNRI